jgi:capsular polysaccharide biosynthesis protein
VSDKRTPGEPAAETLLDLPRLMVAIRRKRRMWLSLALLGLIAGGLVVVFLPPKPTAVTELLIVHENDQASDSGNLMQTDVAVLHTTKIANDALQRVGSRESAEDFLKTYEGTGLTSNMMQIEVTGASERDAVARAQALADAFIADHVARSQRAAAADAKALTDQRDRTQAELTKVNAAIATAQNKITAASKDDNGDGLPDGPENGGVSTTETESLYARRAELTGKISDLTNRAETAGIGAPRVAAGTQIVDAPRAVPSSLLVTGATNAAIGFGLMLAAGITIAAITGVVRDRPVLRRDIAANLGASVIAQLSMPRRGFARYWRAKRATRERRRVAGTLVRLVRDGSRPVSVLELGSPRIAAALALDVAAELANDRDVVIIEDPAGRVVSDDLPGRDLGELTGRADRPIRIVGADQTGPGLPGETRIGIGSVTPGTAWTDLDHLGGETLLVVRTGFANTAWLHTVARQLADNGIPIIGVVLVDPDPRDKSDGTLWDGLHTALRGRAHLALAQAQRPEQTGEAATDQAARPRPYPARKPEWAPEPVAKVAPAKVSTSDSPAGEGTEQAPLPAVYPAPVPANGVNGTRGNPDMATKRFAPVQPHPANENGDEQSVHDLPTKRFAPVRQDVEELAHHRPNS